MFGWRLTMYVGDGDGDATMLTSGDGAHLQPFDGRIMGLCSDGNVLWHCCPLVRVSNELYPIYINAIIAAPYKVLKWVRGWGKRDEQPRTS
jgi:hypothetical protein